MKDRDFWFEDFAPGDVFETAGATLTEAAILDFAREWDPQSFHLDKEAAEASPYGGLIASGFQTMLIAFRLWLAERVMNPSSQGSPGMESVRWIAPVRAGDTIRLVATVESVRASASRPKLGLVGWFYRVIDQRGEEVMSWRCTVMHARRPGDPDAG